ncbi:hypothetical protein KY290_016369 [Solanum tuberosum]|uniref:V-ATPase proteolipid subunit C-like domain-containing protein n=1 Tax=Solanum tuberosum TaxID=4113 RepID=A0ABQ7VJ24_SOLTU|nr:hypothetical protein KY290_016369 [Solanum tuberosum]
MSKIKRTRGRIDEASVLEEKIGAATIASAGAAIGIGNVLSSSIHSVARNPSLAKQLFGYAILGFALTEAIASFAPMMAFLISFVFQWEEDRWERAEREQSKFQWWAVFAVPFHRLFLGKSRSNRSQDKKEKGGKVRLQVKVPNSFELPVGSYRWWKQLSTNDEMTEVACAAPSKLDSSSARRAEAAGPPDCWTGTTDEKLLRITEKQLNRIAEERNALAEILKGLLSSAWGCRARPKTKKTASISFSRMR